MADKTQKYAYPAAFAALTDADPDADSLEDAILASAITVALDYIDVGPLDSPGEVVVVFKANLLDSPDEKAILDSIVATHTGEPTEKREAEVNEHGAFKVSPSFGTIEGLTTNWSSYTISAGDNAVTIHDSLITTELKLHGGWYELVQSPVSPLTHNARVGDIVKFSVIDKNDTLGMFGALGLTVGVDILELKQYVVDEINPFATARQVFTPQTVFAVIPGLFLRTTVDVIAADANSVPNGLRPDPLLLKVVLEVYKP
jgi:hypothetical protein